MKLQAIINANDGMFGRKGKKIIEKYLSKNCKKMYLKTTFDKKIGEYVNHNTFGKYTYLSSTKMKDILGFYQFLSENKFALLDSKITKERGE
ncbi:MAG: hypothetical protein AABW81_03910 [Nanoarchaeota archaeon]